MPRNITPVTAFIVHKSDDDDVFVDDPQLVIPDRIPTERLNPCGMDALVSTGLYHVSPSRDLVATAADKYAAPGFLNVDNAQNAVATPSTVLRSDTVKLPLTIAYRVKNLTDHYYFYRKEHEHVPGLMLIEIARQAMYHYVYNSYDIERGQVSISMSSLFAQFDDYTETAYPLSVVVSQNDAEYTASPRHIDLVARFVQNGKWIGSVTLKGGVMKTTLFQRLRRFDPGENRWFAPFANWDTPVLVEGADGVPDNAKLQTVSVSGATIRVKSRSGSSLPCIQRLVIPTKILGCITLPVTVTHVEGDDVHVDFSSSAPHPGLCEFIKRYCTLTETPAAVAGVHR